MTEAKTDLRVLRTRKLIMDSFIEPIGTFIGILGIGVICGGIGFVIAYRRKSESD